jgi:hypothetical protein
LEAPSGFGPEHKGFADLYQKGAGRISMLSWLIVFGFGAKMFKERGLSDENVPYEMSSLRRAIRCRSRNGIVLL